MLNSRKDSTFVRWVICVLLVATTTTSTASAADSHISDIVFSPDGKQLIASSNEGLAIYRWPDLSLIKRISTESPHPTCLRFSPTQSYLAVGGGIPSESGTIEIFSWPTLTKTKTITAHSDQIMSLAWRDNNTVITASLDHDIRVIDLQNGESKQLLQGHSRGVTDLCLINNRSTLVSGSLDQSIRVWDTNSGALQRTSSNHTHPVQAVAVAPSMDGLPLMASASDDRTIRIWQPTIGRLVRFIRLETTPLDIDWIDSKTIAASCKDGKVHLIDTLELEVLATHEAINGWAFCIACHPTLDGIAVAGERGQIKRITLDNATTNRE